MSLNDVTIENNSVTTDPKVPTYTDKTKIIWDGNDASIAGLLYEVGRFFKRTGQYQMLFKHRAVPASRNQLAVDDYNTVYFLTGKLSDTHDWDNPAPPTPQRYADANTALTTAGKRPAPDLKSMPDQLKNLYVKAVHLVDAAKSELLVSLTHVFGHAETSEEFIDSANGDGLELIDVLKGRYAGALRQDRALVNAVYTRIATQGIPTELTLGSFKAWLKKYKAAKRNVPAAARHSADQEVEMISLAAMKDKEVRALYVQKADAKDPTTLDQAADMVLSILRGLKRADEIDQAVSGAYDGASLGLAAECDNDDSPDTTLAANTALLASLTKSGATAAQLAMIASALTPVADPNKPGPNKPKDKPKVEVPRDKDGNITKWIPGMNTCRCGVNGGRHLFRDCPKLLEKKAKAEKEEKAKAERAKADKTKAAALLANVSDASEAELRTALLALLGGK